VTVTPAIAPYADRLEEAVQAKNSAVCVGIDPRRCST
jgi:hypothetical protein